MSAPCQNLPFNESKIVEIKEAKRDDFRLMNRKNAGSRTYWNALKCRFRGFDSLRPLQIPMQKPLTPTSARGFLFSGFTA